MCLEYETRQAGEELQGVKFYMLLSQVGVGGGVAALCGGSDVC